MAGASHLFKPEDITPTVAIRVLETFNGILKDSSLFAGTRGAEVFRYILLEILNCIAGNTMTWGPGIHADSTFFIQVNLSEIKDPRIAFCIIMNGIGQESLSYLAQFFEGMVSELKVNLKNPTTHEQDANIQLRVKAAQLFRSFNKLMHEYITQDHLARLNLARPSIASSATTIFAPAAAASVRTAMPLPCPDGFADQNTSLQLAAKHSVSLPSSEDNQARVLKILRDAADLRWGSRAKLSITNGFMNPTDNKVAVHELARIGIIATVKPYKNPAHGHYIQIQEDPFSVKAALDLALSTLHPSQHPAPAAAVAAGAGASPNPSFTTEPSAKSDLIKHNPDEKSHKLNTLRRLLYKCDLGQGSDPHQSIATLSLHDHKLVLNWFASIGISAKVQYNPDACNPHHPYYFEIQAAPDIVKKCLLKELCDSAITPGPFSIAALSAGSSAHYSKLDDHEAEVLNRSLSQCNLSQGHHANQSTAEYTHNHQFILDWLCSLGIRARLQPYPGACKLGNLGYFEIDASPVVVKNHIQNALRAYTAALVPKLEPIHNNPDQSFN